MIKTKWLLYTVIIGLIPTIIRLFVFILSNERSWNFLSSSIDFVFFGLVLNLTNLNELGNEKIDITWRTKFSGYSTIQIVIFSALLGMLYFSEQQETPLVNELVSFITSIMLGIVSFVVSYAIFSKLNLMYNERA